MWIKICANTNLEDARLAADLGATALGFVFAPSPRRVTPSQVAEITAKLQEPIERIGVFQTKDEREIVSAVREAQLTGVQLHGSLDLALVHRLSETFGREVTIIQTLHWSTDGNAVSQVESLGKQLTELQAEHAISHVLIDSRVGSATGGTGVPFDWKSASALLRQQFGRLKLIVAGGLRPENVQEAISDLCPWGVDVASGVEARPGKKDRQKIEAFLRNASIGSSSLG